MFFFVLGLVSKQRRAWPSRWGAAGASRPDAGANPNPQPDADGPQSDASWPPARFHLPGTQHSGRGRAMDREDPQILAGIHALTCFPASYLLPVSHPTMLGGWHFRLLILTHS